MREEIRKLGKKKRKSLPTGQIVIGALIVGYIWRFGLFGLPIFYGSMEHYMEKRLEFRYHREFEMTSVVEDNSYLFSSGGYYGHFIEKETGEDYSCYYFFGHLQEDYGVRTALEAILYAQLNQIFLPSEEIRWIEYKASFVKNKRHWSATEQSLKKAIKKKILRHTYVKMELKPQKLEEMTDIMLELYQKVNEFEVPCTLECWLGEYKLGSFNTDSVKEVTRETIQKNIENALKGN